MPKRLVVRSFMAISVALSLVLTNSTFAYADSKTIRFENPPYPTGSISGHDGWAGFAGAPINPVIDQAVVNNSIYGYSGLGQQSWRFSNVYVDGGFDWPYSPSLVNEAGETSATNLGFSGGIRQRHFEAQLNFASTVKSAEQQGLQMSMAPDRGDGARMSFIRLKDLPAGLSVEFSEYQDNPPYGSTMFPADGCNAFTSTDGFVTTTIASGLRRDRVHTVRLTMDFKDGAHNDVVKVYVDGSLRKTGGSWEDYFRWCEATPPGQSRTVDSMIFQARANAGACLSCGGMGFLIDNLSYFSGPGECRRGDGDGDFEDNNGHKHHAKFHHDDCDDNGHGDFEDDDSDAGKRFQSTSVDSANYTSNADSTTLTMIGTGVEDGLPVGFTMVAIDSGGAVPAVYTMTLTNGRTFTGTLVSGVLQIQ